jgi:2-(1,2-epoxy-1,2-dihydrophenyl)acetyl-CoA isomerase
VFATGFARLGLSGDGGCTWFLPRLVGLRRAQEMEIGGRVLTAAEALDWGLVTRTVPAADLASEAEALATRLAAGPTVALAAMRRLLRESWGATLEQQLDAESAAITRSARSADAREGITAFAARRPPRFTGRKEPR